MKTKLFPLIVSFVFITISCNKTIDSKNLEKDTDAISKVSEIENSQISETSGIPVSEFDIEHDSDLYKHCILVLEMPFKARNSDYKLKVRMREDLASRKFNETSCENNGLLVTYGSEYIIELFKVNGHINGSDFLEGRNFINIDLIRRMDVYGEIEKIENL